MLSEYLKNYCGSSERLPETKRTLYHVIEQRLQRGGAFNLAIGGLRKIGKTTLLRQLAANDSSRLYINLAYVKDMNTRFEMLNELTEWIKNKRVSVLLLDEICKVVYYDDFIQEIVNFASSQGIPVIMTASTRYYLRQLMRTTLGGRCRYVEMYPLSYYEYLTFVDAGIEQYYYSGTKSFKEYESIKKYIDGFKPSEESFKDYLIYCADNMYLQSVEGYVESCYEELIDTELSYTIQGADVSGSISSDVMKALLYVLQYKLVTDYKNKKNLFEAARKYNREVYTAKKQSILFEAEPENMDTTLHEYLDVLRYCDRSEVVDAFKALVHLGLLNVLTVRYDYESLEEVKSKANQILNGCIKGNLDTIFSSGVVVTDLGIYLNILKEFVEKSGIESMISLLGGPLFGEVIEFYVTTQLMLLSRKQYSIKFRSSGKYASEIDIAEDVNKLLVEVGVGDKHKTNLMFCEAGFDERYPEYKDFEKLYISSEDKQHQDAVYQEMSYYTFGLYVDAKIIGQYIKDIG